MVYTQPALRDNTPCRMNTDVLSKENEKGASNFAHPHRGDKFSRFSFILHQQPCSFHCTALAGNNYPIVLFVLTLALILLTN